MSIQDGGVVPAETTRTPVAKGTMPTETRVEVVWVPNMVFRKLVAAVFRPLILVVVPA